ncbi:MAG TPA: hypothetical protein VF676_00295 [Flavobacterium sp.]|jgi:hypothetical protein
MRNSILCSAIGLAIVSGCGNKKQDTHDQPGPEVKNEQPVVDSARECFEWVKGNDTVSLQYARKVNNVTGELRYAWYEKDKSAGTFVGVFKGDTLRADYTFQSEGMESVREIVFVRRGDQLLQGNGEMEDKNGKMIFSDRGQLDFSNTIALIKTDCGKK